MKIKHKYLLILQTYLRWGEDKDNLFLPELIEYNSEGLSSEVIMYQYESLGIKIPKTCSNPLLLAKYIQGKTLRDFFIAQWIKDIKEGLAFKQEFYPMLYELGEDPNKIFKNY
jgi:hypothetical protein